MDNKQRYIVPPKMSATERHGGFTDKEIGVLVVFFVVILMLLMTIKQSWTFYLFVIPVIYGITVYRFDDHNGAEFFKRVLHYLWTPQTYVLTPLRKEDTDDE